MKQFITEGIVLSRTDFGEADRIITVITPDYGKLRLIAKGVRKIKSKLAGGIELFSVSNISFIKGRGEIDTLISTRLIQHYKHITSDLQRVQLGYELIKLLNSVTEDNVGIEYFDLLKTMIQTLDKLNVDIDLIRTWYYAQLLKLSGHSPNLLSDASGHKLQTGQSFSFNLNNGTLIPQNNGNLTTQHVKLLRLIFSHNRPWVLQQVNDMPQLLTKCTPIVQAMLNTFVRV
jgi:DNA repair protein RecO (recombination protein O)